MAMYDIGSKYYLELTNGFHYLATILKEDSINIKIIDKTNRERVFLKSEITQADKVEVLEDVRGTDERNRKA